MLKYEEMEFMAPPIPKYEANAPRNIVEVRLASPSLRAAFDAYTGECAGGDRYDNNCAHFLSDAFIRAGFTELLPPNPHINARCNTPAKRPIRPEICGAGSNQKQCEQVEHLNKIRECGPFFS